MLWRGRPHQGYDCSEDISRTKGKGCSEDISRTKSDRCSVDVGRTKSDDCSEDISRTKGYSCFNVMKAQDSKSRFGFLAGASYPGLDDGVRAAAVFSGLLWESAAALNRGRVKHPEWQ